jgi:ankyrin repeat protein
MAQLHKVKQPSAFRAKAKLLSTKVKLFSNSIRKIRKKGTLMLSKLYDYLFEVDERLDNALIKAAIQGRENDVAQLIKIGANVNTKDYLGRTALMHASKNREPSAYPAAGYCFRHLLYANGTDVDIKDKDGMTALMHAANKGNSYFCLELIRKHADVNARDNKGQTAFSYASSHNHTAWVLAEEMTKNLFGGRDAIAFVSSFDECLNMSN